MKKTLIVLLLLLQSICYAQNYQCLQANVKHYFLNGANYLRGIRIDSVVTSGSDIVYYPFRSIRKNIDSVGSIDTSGSWLGKKVVQKADGTFQFDGRYHDTVFINTQASLGQSWLFYNDTAAYYYTATVYALDTITVLGTLDSVKKIIVTSSSNNDAVDSMYIYLSKNNGLVRTFDLFNFPFRNLGIDDFFVQASANNGSVPFPDDQDFHITPLHIPTQKEVYNFHPNDALGYTYDLMGDCCGMGGEYTGWDYDSILTRNDIDAYHTQLIYYHKNYRHYQDCVIPPNEVNMGYYVSIDTLYADTSAVIHLSLMPEECGLDSVFTYNTADTAYGITSLALRAYGIWPLMFEDPTNITDYKTGLGIIDSDVQYYSTCWNAQMPIGGEHTAYLAFGVKDGQGFGNRFDLGVENNLINKANSIVIYPNPANAQVSILGYDNNKKYLVLTDAAGRVLKQSTTYDKQTTMSTESLSSGIYYLSVTDDNGAKTVNKICVVH
jgi:hypothetical protein